MRTKHTNSGSGLALEEIAAKFGDEVAVDLSHLSDDRRRALDEDLIAVGADLTETPTGAEQKSSTTHQEMI